MWVNKIKVHVVVDSGASGNIVSTKLMKKLRLVPDIVHSQSYGMAGPEKTTSLGAYYALPLRFGNIQMSALVIVLPNKSYNLLLGTAFFRKFKTKINYK